MNRQSSRDLVAAAYDTELVRRCGALLSEVIADHFAMVQQSAKPVQKWCPPSENVQLALEIMDAPHWEKGNCEQELDELAERFGELVRISLRRGQNLHHPRCVGHQVPAAIPLAGFFDAVTTLTNQVQGVYEMGPWCVSAERAVLARVGEAIGFQSGQFGGLITSGGSLANLTALLAARNLRCKDFWKSGSQQAGPAPVLVVQGEAHYCVERAAGVMGIGTDHLIRIPVDEHGRMQVDALEVVLKDLENRNTPVIAVVAVSCTTPTGAFDPIERIATICQRHKVWLHVDAAHGGALCFSRQHRHLVAGLHLADSVVVDAHKMMFLPAVCAMVFYKNKQHRFDAFHQSAPYLFDPSAPEMAEYDNAVVTFECTKRAAALGLWGIWSMFGPSLFEAMIDGVIEVAQTFHRMLAAHESFETGPNPTCNIVVFRFLPQQLRDAQPAAIDLFQLQLRRHLLEQGAAYLTQTRINGSIFLRATIMNPLTNTDAILQIIESMQELGGTLLSDAPTECRS